MILLSCSRDDQIISDIFHTWVIKSIHTGELPKPSLFNRGKVNITFNTNLTYGLELELNVCGGVFTTSENDSISLSDLFCTQMCCDSKFSDKLLTMLPEIKTHEIDGLQLILYSDNGYIMSKLHE